MKKITGNGEYTTLHLASLPKYYYKKIIIECIVSGKALSLYYIPKKIKVKCQRNKKNLCLSCILNLIEELEISENYADILSFIDATDTKVFENIRKMFNIPKICPVQYKVIEPFNMEQIFLIPSVNSYQKIDSKYVNRLAYYVGNDIECNTPYKMLGYSIPDPKNQKVVHIITKIKPLKDDISNFVMTQELHEKLKIFQPKENTVNSIYDKLKELYNIYSKNITKIYNRFDLHMGIDLVFHSPLSFNFNNNQFVKKGWGDILILGDSRTGKGWVSERLAAYYNIGETISGENASYAGLIGGVEQLSKNWTLTWGKIPQNDKKLLIVDEAGNLQDTDWSRLSRVRSEGVAEITKIRTEITNARTRLIFICNPVQKRLLNSYGYGIEAIGDVVKCPEDIARFDYVLITANNEVSMDVTNTVFDEIENHYQRELEKKLILWIWSRKAEQIYFTNGATNDILKLSIELGKTYNSSIPLIQGENVRFKLAKIAIMIAGRLYSSNDSGENIIVDQCHVMSAYEFLNIIYKKNTCGYYTYSQLKNKGSSIRNIEKVKEYLDSFESSEIIYEVLLNTNQITGANLEYAINQPREIIKELLCLLLSNNCIEQKYQYYYKKEAFTKWLKQNTKF